MATSIATIIRTNQAQAHRKICEAIYKVRGASAVIDYANKIHLDYNLCLPCAAEMPMISCSNMTTCAVCGTSK